MASCQVAFLLAFKLACSGGHIWSLPLPLFPQVSWLLRLAPLCCSSNRFWENFSQDDPAQLSHEVYLWPIWEFIQLLPCQILEAWLFQHCPSSSCHCSWSHKFFLAQVRKVLYSPLQGWEWSPSHWNLSKETAVSSLSPTAWWVFMGGTLVPLFTHLRATDLPALYWNLFFEISTVCSCFYVAI